MSKFSEELYINAMRNSVSFSATNTSQSAYCRFTYDRSFFTKFNVGDGNVRDEILDLDDAEQLPTVTGQLCVQVLCLRSEVCFLTQTMSIAAPTRDSQAQRPRENSGKA